MIIAGLRDEDKFLTKRAVMFGIAMIAISDADALAQGPVLPFVITVRRRLSFTNVIGDADCIFGALFIGDKRSFDGSKSLCDTLEIKDRAETEEASSIKAGIYQGIVRTTGTLGWRIELVGTKQKNIQIHQGNGMQNTHGCILVGNLPAKPQVCTPSTCKTAEGRIYATACTIENSLAAKAAIRLYYGGDNSRPVTVFVVDALA